MVADGPSILAGGVAMLADKPLSGCSADIKTPMRVQPKGTSFDPRHAIRSVGRIGSVRPITCDEIIVPGFIDILSNS
jgi:hypothetical protein